MSVFSTLQEKLIPSFVRERLKGRTELKKVLANTGWMMTDTVIQIVTNLFVGVWVARYLGPDLRGIMIYANSYVNIFISISALGLGAIMIREIVRQPQAKNLLMGTVFFAQLTSYLLLIPIMIVGVVILRPGEALVLWSVIILAMGNVFSTNRIFKFWFQSQLQSKYSVYATRIVEFSSAAVKVALLVSGASLIAFVSVLAAQSVFNFFLSAYYYTRTGERLLNWRFDSMYFKAMLRDSWPLALSIIAITMYVEIDNLMLGQLLDNYAVGVFGEAARISNMWYFIPAAIAASMYPVLVKSRQTLSVENYNRRVQKFLDVLVLIGYLSAVPASILAPFLISLFYGPEFAETGRVLSIYVWTFVFVGLREGMNRWLMVDNYTIYAMYVALVGAGTNIMLNFVFIPKFGVIGAAWATLISNIFALYGVCLVFPKLHPLLRQLILAIFAPFRIKSLIS